MLSENYAQGRAGTWEESQPLSLFVWWGEGLARWARHSNFPEEVTSKLIPDGKTVKR